MWLHPTFYLPARRRTNDPSEVRSLVASLETAKECKVCDRRMKQHKALHCFALLSECEVIKPALLPVLCLLDLISSTRHSHQHSKLTGGLSCSICGALKLEKCAAQKLLSENQRPEHVLLQFVLACAQSIFCLDHLQDSHEALSLLVTSIEGQYYQNSSRRVLPHIL